jgi:hypothetical protein
LKLIYGTTNKAKIDFMKRRVESLGIEILSLNDVDEFVNNITLDNESDDVIAEARQALIRECGLL